MLLAKEGFCRKVVLQTFCTVRAFIVTYMHKHMATQWM